MTSRIRTETFGDRALTLMRLWSHIEATGKGATLSVYREDLSRGYSSPIRYSGKVIVSWYWHTTRGTSKVYRRAFTCREEAIAWAQGKAFMLTEWAGA